MLTLYLVQALLPIILIARLAICPPRSVIAFWVQSIAIGFTLLALSFVGIWTFPPWWAVYAFGALLAVTVGVSLARKRALTQCPHGIVAWMVLFGFAGLGLYAANETRVAYAATAMPLERPVDLASPLGPGTYLVANGGAAVSVNAHAELLDQSIPATGPIGEQRTESTSLRSIAGACGPMA